MENFFGLMEEFIKETMKMIRNMVMESLNGKMEENIKDIGKMGNSMEKVDM